MIEVTVVGLAAHPAATNPLLLLQERGGPRVVPVGIGPLEAQAIALPLQGVSPPRPMTHDAFVDVLVGLGGHVRRVEVTQLVENTFYARLVLEQLGEEREFDIRPSDAIALAVRTEAPIYVDETVLDQAGVVPEQPIASSGSSRAQAEHAEPSVELDESKLTPFKEFIDTLDIDDLGPES
jgi:bifunctional DNase/RNase